ncbi:probable E3 ubiquitin-protein ligase HIP1 [Phragmites australis]|uniref:probable E3 ubiquitin-protein ligase HIP1 n=1 Tax=Phragmites australis TaxID=29695 RepID=UPI002D7907D9|nr:probable E3 ubiquitin-protein ligase HIP1 [Phragmites australis]XP_062183816.1 probable E3 ubiquitin-protein ligase HIP1 [Phragmites australis]XP_062183817.1 probable E3 ubiquitin-protein ligase HIP1 [Phragmites australis]XP_062183818.1 probable E3 ubiquitin-protein ligase HIP1 [Phragmites australis]
MQHNRITMLSSSETRHLGSSSNNPTMDQQNLLPNNPTVDEQILLPDTLENENYPHYLLNGHEVGMPNGSLIGQQNTSLSLWESAGSSSMGCLVDHGNFLQVKREHFAPSLSTGGPLSIDRRRHEANGSLPSHNLNIDLNVNQADQFGIEDVDVVHGNVQSRTNTASLNRGSSTTERIWHHEISLNAFGSSSQTADSFDGAAGQEFGMLDSHRSSYKRKNVDGNHAETSANGSSRNQYQINNILRSSPVTHESTSLTLPSTNYADSYPPMEQLNQSTNVSASGTLSDHYSLYTDPHESERFMRNTRMRISPNEYDQSLPRLLPEESFRCSAYQPTQQQSSFIPVQPRAISSSATSHSRPHVPAVTQFSQNLHRQPSNGNFGSRIVSSSSSANTTIQRSTSQDPSRSLMRSNVPEPLLLGSSFFNADSTNLLSAPGSRSNQQNSGSSSSSTLRAAVNVGAQQVPASNASQPSTNVRGSADIARSSLFSDGVSHSRSSSIALQHRGPSSTSQEIRSHQPGSSFRAHQQHYFRAGPPSIDRQNSGYLDLQSFMQTIAASREGSRTVSELRDVVDQIRQGRSSRLEDLLLIDRSLIVRRANLIDSHRDMRLDVDNMSYEELLALGERIGYVNTGLTEEKIMSGLKKWKYFCMLLEPLTGVEPCCICQEDYVEGEDMGRLDCGHDFHTACIKQWLVIKNLCPICKKTALGT